ncbi:proline-tRNA ligase [Striga asiatica]|uniref:Proline-tRNA ligase n=1 Tax=Striga asiatica TaxID=4170 RepID=A0A5A7P9K8_STRAF|nr:proline-tRNA ligase [Striga asiatica]
MFTFPLPKNKSEHFQFVQEGVANKWNSSAKELFRFVQIKGMTKESDILDAFENIHQACLSEIDPNLTFKECYVTFMVIKERYLFTVNEKYLHVDGYTLEIAIEPMWDTLTRTFDDLSLDNYPDEQFWKRHPDFLTFE